MNNMNHTEQDQQNAISTIIPRKKANVSKLLRTEFFLLVFLLLILLLLFVAARGFFSLNNTMSILNTSSYLLISAIGMNLIIIISNIDVSTGPLMSVVCIVIAAIGKLNANIFVLMPVAIVTGMILSLINGLFITKLKVPSIVATLATALLFSGGLNLVVNGSIYDLPASFTWLGFNAKLFGFLPLSIIIMVVITVIAIIYMKYSKFSKQIYAVGNSYDAARLSGINADRVVVICYVIAGGLYGISGTIIATASQRVTTTMAGGLLNMTLIAAVALGGTSISGGSGTILGTVFGILILAIIPPATNYLGISPNWSDAIMGVIIIISVIVSATRAVRHKRKKIVHIQVGGES